MPPQVIPPARTLILTTLSKLENQPLAEWVRREKRECFRCKGPHTEDCYEEVREDGQVPGTPLPVCQTCMQTLDNLSRATDVSLAVRWLVERRQGPTMRQSLDTLHAGALRQGRGEPLYTLGRADEARVLALAGLYESSDLVPLDFS